jgi:hypothetical protein
VGSKQIVYGGKSLLRHHHRKAGPPLFSRPPPSPRLSAKETVRRAIEEVRQARVKKAAEGERGKRAREEEATAVGPKKAAKKPNLDVECQLETQKYLRDVRTQHAQLKKAMSSLR